MLDELKTAVTNLEAAAALILTRQTVDPAEVKAITDRVQAVADQLNSAAATPTP